MKGELGGRVYLGYCRSFINHASRFSYPSQDILDSFFA